MDFLDQNNSVVGGKSNYAELLGLGNKKQAANARNSFEADLQNRYPFSDNCDEQKALLAAMYKESAETLHARNSSKKGKGRNELSGKLDAFDYYIPLAADYMNTVSCKVKNQSDTSANIEKNLGINTSEGGAAAAILPSTANKSIMKPLLIGVGALLLLITAVFIVKNRKKQ